MRLWLNAGFEDDSAETVVAQIHTGRTFQNKEISPVLDISATE